MSIPEPAALRRAPKTTKRPLHDPAVQGRSGAAQRCSDSDVRNTPATPPEFARHLGDGPAPTSHGMKGRTGIDRIVHAAGHSLAGLKAAYRGESAFRQEVWLAGVMTPLAFWLGQTWIEVALLLGSVLLVMITELLNSGIEAAIDRISFDLHELSKRAKDMGSAAVLLSLLLCGGIWLAALWHRLA